MENPELSESDRKENAVKTAISTWFRGAVDRDPEARAEKRKKIKAKKAAAKAALQEENMYVTI